MVGSGNVQAVMLNCPLSLTSLSTWKFFGVDGYMGSFWNTFTISTFLPEHPFMLKSYGLEGTFLLIVLFYQSTPSCFKVIGGVVVAHKILLSAPVPIDPLVLELLWFYEWNYVLGDWGWY